MRRQDFPFCVIFFGRLGQLLPMWLAVVLAPILVGCATAAEDLSPSLTTVPMATLPPPTTATRAPAPALAPPSPTPHEHDRGVLAWRTFTTADGMAHNEVWAMDQGPDGSLWFGTSDGVTRLVDGSWTVFHLEDGNGIGAIVRSVAVTADGTVWAGTFMGGVSWSRGGGWTTYRTPIERNDGPIANDVQVVRVCSGGELWVGTRAGLSRYDGGSWSHVTPEEGLAGFDVLAIACGPDGALWVGTRGDFTNPSAGGLSRFDGEQWVSYTEDDGLPQNYVQAVAVEPGGAVWAGTQREGVTRYDERQWASFKVADGLPSDDVTAIGIAPDGTVWIGTRTNGAAQYDGHAWVRVSEADGLASGEVRDIMIAADGSVWFATTHGVSRHVPGG